MANTSGGAKAAKKPSEDTLNGGASGDQAGADNGGATEGVKEMTAAMAAKLVKRPVPRIGKDRKPVLDDDDKPVLDHVAVAAEEVLDFKVRGDEVTVVTVDGQKFKGAVA